MTNCDKNDLNHFLTGDHQDNNLEGKAKNDTVYGAFGHNYLDGDHDIEYTPIYGIYGYSGDGSNYSFWKQFYIFFKEQIGGTKI